MIYHRSQQEELRQHRPTELFSDCSRRLTYDSELFSHTSNLKHKKVIIGLEKIIAFLLH